MVRDLARRHGGGFHAHLHDNTLWRSGSAWTLAIAVVAAVAIAVPAGMLFCELAKIERHLTLEARI